VDFGFRIEKIRNSKSEFRNSLGWLTRPGSQQLGAKWVEVKTAGKGLQLIGDKS
jgi:hypothetical protein